MATIKDRQLSISKKNPTRPRKTLYLNRTVINGQRLKKAAARKRLVARR